MDKRQLLIEDTQTRIDDALKALNEDKAIFDAVMKETTTAAAMLHIYTRTERPRTRHKPRKPHAPYNYTTQPRRALKRI